MQSIWLTVLTPWMASFKEMPRKRSRDHPDWRRGQPGDVAVVVGGEPGQVAAVGADRVPRFVCIGQVGEEVVDVAGERLCVPWTASWCLTPWSR